MVKVQRQRYKKQGLHKNIVLILFLLIILGAGLRLWHLGNKSLWLDEAFTAMITSRDLPYIFHYTVKDRGPLPLTYLFPWVAQKIAANNSEFTLRFFDFIFGVIGLVAIYFLARQLKNDSLFILLAVFLLSFSAFHHYYSQEARGYTAIVLLSILQFYFLWQAIEAGSKGLKWWGLYYLALATAFYFSLFTLFLVINNFLWAIGVLLFFASDRFSFRQKREKILLLSAVTLLLLLTIGFWLIFALPYLRGGYIKVAKLSSARTLLFFADAFVRFTGEKIPLALFFLLILLSGFRTVLRRFHPLLLYPFLYFFVAFLGFTLSPASHFLHSRYIISALPFFLLSFSLSLMELKKLPIPKQIYTSILVALMAGYLMVNLIGIRRNFIKEKQNWRAAGEFIAENFRPDDALFAGTNSCSVALYYYLLPALRGYLSPEHPNTADLNNLIRRGKRVWYVTAYYRWSYPWRNPPYLAASERLYYDWLDRYFQLIKTFPGEDDVKIFLSKPLTKSR